MKILFLLILLSSIQLKAQEESIDKLAKKNSMNNSEILNIRQGFDKLGLVYPSAENITVTKELISNVICYWFSKPEDVKRDSIIIYLHGGAFALGSINSHKALMSNLNANFSIPILFIEYGLAPENPFPMGLNDILAVYTKIKLNYPKFNIFLMGDSAGGGLAVSFIAKLEDENIAVPSKLVLLSPWVNLNCNTESYELNKNSDVILTRDGLLNFAKLYATDVNFSKANPFDNIKHLYPETLILVGSSEILLDDSKSTHNKLLKLGTKSKISIYPNQQHVWLFDSVTSKDSKSAINEIELFLKN